MNEWDELGFNAQNSGQQDPNLGQQYAPPGGGQYQGYAPQGQGYAPQYNPAPPRQPSIRGGQGGSWIGLLRTLAWIWFALICLAGLICFFVFMQESALMGFVCLLAAVVVAFFSVAGIMVMLDAATNLMTCANNSAHIARTLQEKK